MRTPRWLVVTYALIILFGIVTALPNLFPQPVLAQVPGWLPKQQVTLGLDLRGGSHLVLEVDARALVQERLQSLQGDARRELAAAGIDTKSVRVLDKSVVVVLQDPARQADAVRALQGLATPVGMASFGGGTLRPHGGNRVASGNPAVADRGRDARPDRCRGRAEPRDRPPARR